MTKQFEANNMYRQKSRELDVLDFYPKLDQNRMLDPQSRMLDGQSRMLDYSMQPVPPFGYPEYTVPINLSVPDFAPDIMAPPAASPMAHMPQQPAYQVKYEDAVLPLPSYPLSPHLRPYAKRERARVKLAHNVIEQRYRNKINDKFTALQNSVPTLRVLARKSGKARSDDDESDDDVETLPVGDAAEDLEGLEPARKLNKGTILAKSVEYIKFLEQKNDRLRMVHQLLVERARMLGVLVDDMGRP